MEWWVSHQDRDEYGVISCEFDNRTIGTSEALLLSEYKQFGMHGNGNLIDMPIWSENVKKTMITLAGKPCLELHWNQKLTGITERTPTDLAESLRRGQMFFAVYVIASDNRLYVIECTTHGKAPAAETLKTICDSFEIK
jgi:hypothetical protein